ncbi:MAG: phenylalanine--tRNA ligase subunit alpha, partial [Spirochaetales bacterium]|nr:phenylalanine--tRNA ligase subunit alpha [Spirochaetales bacterium]
MDFDLKSLHPLEIRLLRHVAKNEEITTERITGELSYKLGQCNQAFSWLSAKSYITETSRNLRILYEITGTGKDYVSLGTPEVRIINLLKDKGSMKMPAIADKLGLENKDVGSAFGQLSKEGILKMDGDKNVEITDSDLPARITLLVALLTRGSENGILDESDFTPEELSVMKANSKKRGAAASPFKIIEREDLVYELSDEGEEVRNLLLSQGLTGEEIGSLTPEMLSTGSWKDKEFREYNINTPPNRVLLGRRNPYSQYLQWVKDKL